jgi:hypothetical protein
MLRERQKIVKLHLGFTHLAYTNAGSTIGRLNNPVVFASVLHFWFSLLFFCSGLHQTPLHLFFDAN